MAQQRRTNTRKSNRAPQQQSAPTAQQQQYGYGAQNQPVDNGQFQNNPYQQAPQQFQNQQQWPQQGYQQNTQYYPPNQMPGYGQPQQQGFEVNTDTGGLFKNNRKNPGDRKPDYTGNANINGVMYWVSGWMRKSKGGMSYMSLAFTPQDDSQHPHQEMNPPTDILPF